jgi:hypothetical protein
MTPLINSTLKTMRQNRRQFLKTSAGFTAVALLPNLWSCTFLDSGGSGKSGDGRLPKKEAYDFVPYQPKQTAAPVMKVTPDDGYYLHTFYDVCPFSPSQRYLAVTKLPYQDRKPVLGDVAEVCVIDLKDRTIQTVYATRAWSFQLGANVQWGASDGYVYTNDVIDGQAVCVRIDLSSGEVKAYTGPKYDLASDGSAAIGPRLDIINATQFGYGIPDPDGRKQRWAVLDRDGKGTAHEICGPPDKNGLWFTDLETNTRKLLVSRSRIRETIQDPNYYDKGIFHFFHSKFNKDHSRIWMHIRCLLPGRKTNRNPSMWTCKSDGTELVEFYPREKFAFKGPMGRANHFNWHPDGEHIVANTVPHWQGDKMMRFSMMRYDGSEYRVLAPNILGSGHPTVDAETRFVVADTYPYQTFAGARDGKVPIRLIELETQKETVICMIWNDFATRAGYKSYKRVKGGGSQLKLDPHPAWSRDYKKICFNGAPEFKRQVFIADLSGLV